MRKRLLTLALLLSAGIFAFNGTAYGWGTTGGDGSRYTQLQETAVFFNNSGGTLTAGDVVVLDTTGTGVSSGSTLGGYVTTTTTADNTLTVGVVKSVSVGDQKPVAVVTRGPVGANCDNANGTQVNVSVAVGTYTTAKTCDSGTNLGVALAGGDITNALVSGVKTWIWVQGIGTE